MTIERLPKGVLMMGSVPLRDAEEVFRTCARTLGDRLTSLPDGETGARLSWLGHQRARFDRHPQLERLDLEAQIQPGSSARYRVKAGSKLRFDSLGYSEFARNSYAIFQRLQSQGIICESIRFQVSMPTPLNMLSFFVPEDREEVESALQRAFVREIELMIQHIGPKRLAIQWDMPREVAILQDSHPAESTALSKSIASKLNQISAAIPEQTMCGSHLCCGDRHYRPIAGPKDLSVFVRLATTSPPNSSIV